MLSLDFSNLWPSGVTALGGRLFSIYVFASFSLSFITLTYQIVVMETMETYKGFYITGKAGLVHAFSPGPYVAGAIYKQGPREFHRRGYALRVALVQDDGSGLSRVPRP